MQGGITVSQPQLFEKGNISFISSVILQIQMQRRYFARQMGFHTLQAIQLKLNDTIVANIE